MIFAPGDISRRRYRNFRPALLAGFFYGPNMMITQSKLISWLSVALLCLRLVEIVVDISLRLLSLS